MTGGEKKYIRGSNEGKSNSKKGKYTTCGGRVWERGERGRKGRKKKKKIDQCINKFKKKRGYLKITMLDIKIKNSKKHNRKITTQRMNKQQYIYFNPYNVGFL